MKYYLFQMDYLCFKSDLKVFDSNLADSLIILYGDNPSIRTPFGLERELEKNKLEKYDLVDFIADELARNDSTSALVNFFVNKKIKISSKPPQ
ncbi:MAG: hypothetical protein IPI23_10150 [Bacteroidetes bacterium]|nr:hypothetical protein [Bacteroidota bacterium]